MNPLHTDQGVRSAEWHETVLAGVRCWQSRSLGNQNRLAHLMTPRGVDMSVGGDPNETGRTANIPALCKALGAPQGRHVETQQVHGTDVACITNASEHARAIRAAPEVDGLITSLPGIVLLARSADCPLLILYDSRRHVVGLAHSGWRGTLAGMPRALTELLLARFGSDPGDVIAVVSPSARACCYEIKDDVRDKVVSADASAKRHVHHRDGRRFLDLTGLIADQLHRSGLRRSSIHLPDQCTICDTRFYSYRRDGAGTGHTALMTCLS